jgi:hypothetical protein
LVGQEKGVLRLPKFRRKNENAIFGQYCNRLNGKFESLISPFFA